MSASKSASGQNGVARAQSTSKHTQDILAPVPQQASIFLLPVSKRNTNFDDVIEDRDGLMCLSKPMRARPFPSRLVFPVLLLESTIDLLRSRFPGVERQQDSCPEIGFQGSPQKL